MFTGIVEEVGVVTEVRPVGDSREITIRVPAFESLLPGASISVDGACQTVVRTVKDGFLVESIGTTLSRTIFDGYRAGTP